MMRRKPWTILIVICGIMLIVLGITAYSETSFETDYLGVVKNLSRTETLTALRNMFDREYNFTELYHWEHERVTFVERRDSAPSSDPLEILRIGKGKCGEFSELYVALCLAHGIESRLVVSVDVTYRMVWFPQHEWAEVKLGDTWVHVDPSDQVWNQTDRYKGWWRGPCIRIYAFEEKIMTDVTQNYQFDPQVVLNLSKKLQLLGLTMDLLGAFIFAIPLFRSRKEAEEASKAYIGVSPYQLMMRERDRIIAVCGLTMIIIGFAVQAFAVLI